MTAVLYAIGDTTAQQLVERKGLQDHDISRTMRMATYGGVLFAPAATFWFRGLQNKIRFPSSPNLESAARVAADQGLFAGVNLFGFLSWMAITAGEDPKKKLDDAYFDGLKANWMLWPAVQFVNFRFVPLENRLLLANVVSIGMSQDCLSHVHDRGAKYWN
jgi:protein Mpv17